MNDGDRPAGGDEFDELMDPDVERASEVEDATDGTPRPDGGDLADTANTIEDDIAQLVSERDSFKDTALRLQADFENYRRRVSAQHADDIDRATGRLAEGLLPVLDACEAAFVAHPAEVEPLFNLLLVELRRQGLEAMHLEGTAFDPALAEAVLHEPGDGGDWPVVTEVLRSGYTWKGKVLRAAMVKVAG